MSNEFPSLATVRTVDNERLDRPDFDAVVTLVEQSEQGQMGTLLGWGSGVIAPAEVDTTGVTDSAPQKLKLGAFSYYLAVPGLSDDGAHFRSWKGAVFGFDPGAAGQSPFVTINEAYLAATVPPGDAYHANVGLYVRPYAVDTDQDARRAYGAGAETAISTKTRRRILHQFMTSPLDATQNLGWALIAVLDWGSLPASAGAKPTVVWRSLWDNEGTQDQVFDLVAPALDSFRRGNANVTREVNALVPTPDGVYLSGVAFQSVGASRGYGFITALAQMRKVLSYHLKGVGGSAWDKLPTSTSGAFWGLRELGDAVEDLQLKVGGINLLVPSATASGRIFFDTITGAPTFEGGTPRCCPAGVVFDIVPLSASDPYTGSSDGYYIRVKAASIAAQSLVPISMLLNVETTEAVACRGGGDDRRQREPIP